MNFTSLAINGKNLKSLYIDGKKVYEKKVDWKGLTFTSKQNGSTISMESVGTAPSVSMQYSLDGSRWQTFSVGSTVITLDDGESVFFRGTGSSGVYATSEKNYNRFVMSGVIEASGNIMSLVDPTNFESITAFTKSYTFCGLFDECSSLVTAPELPVDGLYGYAYRHMFRACTSLVEAPVLPASIIKASAYIEMFDGCSSLSSATILGETSTDINACLRMFRNCTSLTKISMPYFTGQVKWTDFTLNVAANGDFVYYGDDYVTGTNGIPENWTINSQENPQTYLNFTGLEDGQTVALQANGSAPSSIQLEYSYDKVTWTPWNFSAITLDRGDKVYISAPSGVTNGAFSGSTSAYYTFSCGKISLGGDLRSLRSRDFRSVTSMASRQFYRLFYNQSNLTFGKVYFPFTSSSGSSYCQEVFYGCERIVDASTMTIAAAAGGNGYRQMFQDCSSLVKAPKLTFTTLTSSTSRQCQEMFSGCSSLVETQDTLSIKTLQDFCYLRMYKNCTSLVNAPYLQAVTIKTSAYQEMFLGCTSLKYVKLDATTPYSSSSNNLTQMFDGCTSLECVDWTGATKVPTLTLTNTFANTNDYFKIVVPDSLYSSWIASAKFSAYVDHIVTKTNWNASHPEHILQ